MNIAIVLSGGTGTRLGASVPKQYLEVGGRMIISYCLQTLLESKQIDVLVVVCDEQAENTIEVELNMLHIDTSKLLGFALPGRNRQESILHGLEYVAYYGEEVVAEDAPTMVLVHDAARPLLSQELITNCFKTAEGHDGAMPYLPMKDTVYLADENGCVASLLDRSRVIAGQSPEVFELKKYLAANQALLPDRILEINGSTEPAIMVGMDMATLPGDENNFKITTQADLERFEKIIQDA